MMKKWKAKGFTLVELIVVVAIIGVLVGLTTPAVTRYIKKSKKTKCNTNCASLQAELQTSYVLGDLKVKDGDPITLTASQQAKVACPEGGTITAKMEGGAVRVTCSVHGALSGFDYTGTSGSE